MKFDNLEDLIAYRNTIIKNLFENVCVVSFVKKDGAIRVMTCTSNPSLMPVYDKKTDKIRPPNQNIISTFDLNKMEYRSFIVENILDVAILKKEEVQKYVNQDSKNQSASSIISQ